MNRLPFLFLISLLSFVRTDAQIYYADTLTRLGLMPHEDAKIIEIINAIYSYDEHEGDTSAYYDPIPEVSFDRVAYAPDSSFRIFRWEWEECGAYCNTNDHFVLAYEDLEKHELAFYDFKTQIRGRVDSIYLLEKDTYLIFQSYGARARSIETLSCLSVRLVSLFDSTKTKWQFSFCTSNLATYDQDILEMHFDLERLELSYRYQYYDWDNPDRVYIRSGTWHYSDRNFNIQEEKTVYSTDGPK